MGDTDGALGSAGHRAGIGIAFLDATVVNVALPTIGTDLNASVAGLQWIVNGTRSRWRP